MRIKFKIGIISIALMLVLIIPMISIIGVNTEKNNLNTSNSDEQPEGLKTSNDDVISIITPEEDEEFMLPMQGYFAGTYGFENEDVGTTGTDIDFLDTDWSTGTSGISICEEVGGHKKVLDCSNTNDGICAFGHELDNSISKGTIEFYWRCNNILASPWIFMIIDETGIWNVGFYKNSIFGLYWYDGTNYITLNQPINSNTWYHFRVEFDMILGKWNLDLDGARKLTGGTFINSASGNAKYIKMQGHLNVAHHFYVDAFSISNYYGETNSFENEDVGTTGTNIDFIDVDWSTGTSGISICKEIGGHKKVLDCSNTNNGISAFGHELDNPVSEGTIEFYWRCDNSWASPWIFMIIDESGRWNVGFYKNSIFGLYWYDGTNYITLNQLISANTWYHFRVDFNMILGKWNLYVNRVGILTGGTFINSASGNARYIKMQGHQNVAHHFYVDDFCAPGPSADYQIGDNINQGLLIDIETTIALEKIEYKLDGMASIKIKGDTVIPFPENGPHSIEVIGYDFLGTTYSSGIRNFIIIDFPPGVLGRPAKVKVKNYPLIGLTNVIANDPIFLPVVEIGFYTDTPYPNQLFIDGPDRYIFWWLIPFSAPYADTSQMKSEVIELYCPLIMLESESWYSHQYDFVKSTSKTSTVSVSGSLGYRPGFSKNIYVYGGTDTTTVTTETMGWTETTENGATKVIYVYMTFLHVYGSITYWNGEVQYYDVVALQEIHFNNIFVLRYGANEIPKETPLLNPSYYDTDPDDGEPYKQKDLASNGIYYIWEQTKIYSTYWGIDLSWLFKSGKEFWKGITINGKIEYIEKTSETTALKHSFFPSNEPMDCSYYYYRLDNAYSLNIEPHYD